MNAAPRRFAATTLVLAAAAVSGAAAAGGWTSAQPLVLMAIVWLLLLGWGFRTLLGRHLRAGDRLVHAEAQAGQERHARALAERALADTHAALCRLIHQQEQVRETERRRIARDIHDDLGQHLLAMKMELALMQADVAAPGTPVHQKVGKLLQNLDLTIASLRAIINDLRPPALERGLQSAMEHQLAEFSRLNGIGHRLEAAPDAFASGQDRVIEAMLFRILQEALANVARHAQATEVQVGLERSGDLLTMKVRDNGVGMARRGDAPGCGLAGIADRVAVAGGRFAIDSEPGAGTLLSLSIPLQRPLASH